MKNYTKHLLLLAGLALIAGSSAFAQQFQGIATYQSSRKMDGFNIKMDGMAPEMQDKIKAQLQKQFQKEYSLKFNLTESVWKEVESLEGGPATASGNGVMIRMSTGGGVTYKNTAENLYIQENEVFSKPFLVKDELEPREWKITDETKKIGNYNALKAILTDIRESRSISFTSDSENKSDSAKSEIKVDTVHIEAWFTTEIPVSQGPDEFWGLPGLILELKNGSVTYLCTQVVLNPAEGVEIKQPSKGKEVTREELRKEIDLKTEEMQKKFSNERGGNVHIKIGGN